MKVFACSNKEAGEGEHKSSLKAEVACTSMNKHRNQPHKEENGKSASSSSVLMKVFDRGPGKKLPRHSMSVVKWKLNLQSFGVCPKDPAWVKVS